MPGKLMKFDLPKGQSSIIKVIGVGGGGSNAVNHMFSQGIKGVDFVVCNTDSQDLDRSPVPHKIQLGAGLTEGLGAGGDPNVGKNSALENIEQIKEILETNTQMVFITAGMGGGTGTGGAPVIASIAKEMNILTVGIVTIPFSNEGPKRMEQAEEGLERLRESVDAMIIICNDKLREMYGNLTLSTAFLQADNVLATAARGIAEMISVHGTINVDFRDVSTVMKDSGVAIMGSAVASGENRAVKAVEMALASPLLNDNKITGARYVLLNITTGVDEPLLDEITDISDFVQQEAGNIANVIMGVSTDETMEDSLGVTIIAAGFETNPDLGFVGAKQPDRIVRNLNDNPGKPTIVHQLDDAEAGPTDTNSGTKTNTILPLDGEKSEEEKEKVVPPIVEKKPPVFPPTTNAVPAIDAPTYESPESLAKEEENVIEDTPERKVFELKMDDKEDVTSVASAKDDDEEMKLVIKEDKSVEEEVVLSNGDSTEDLDGEDDLFGKPMAGFDDVKEEATEKLEKEIKAEEDKEVVEENEAEIKNEVVAEEKGEVVSGVKEDESSDALSDLSSEAEAKGETSTAVKDETLAKDEPKMDAAAKKKQAELDAILNKFPSPPQEKEAPKAETKEDENKEDKKKSSEVTAEKSDDKIEEQETVGKAEVTSDTSKDEVEEIEEANIPEFKLMGDSSDTNKEEDKSSDFEFDLSTDTESSLNSNASTLSSLADDDNDESSSGISSMSDGGSDSGSYSSPNSMNQEDRISKLKELSYKLRTPSGLSDLEDQPAYMRRNVDLDDVPHSSASEVSRYTLNDSEDGEDKVELKPDNPFLHDNVD